MLQDYDLKKLVEPLQSWFGGHARVLPWRENPCAYYVWISEIMLQQTRVEAVKPYFARFVEALPDVQALAQCPEERYLKLWEGLGYYNRVRNLHAAAQQIVTEYGGVVPDSFEELVKLKGIGSYTAGAIASIAYNRPTPAVDGNVLRVLSRVSADDSDIMKASVKKEMETRLRSLMEDRASGVVPRTFNQALMELGALVCTPNGEPHCADCPWESLCEARRQGCQLKLPVRIRAKGRRIEEKTVFVIRDGERVALRKRPAKGLLAGLYELPNCPGKLTDEEALGYLKGLGLQALRIRPLAEAKHIFSHVEWHMRGYAVLVEEPEDEKAPGKLLFVEAQDAKERYAVPSAFAAYWKAIVEAVPD
jgi:A/G-specific adenine glycosylase